MGASVLLGGRMGNSDPSELVVQCVSVDSEGNAELYIWTPDGGHYDGPLTQKHLLPAVTRLENSNRQIDRRLAGMVREFVGEEEWTIAALKNL
jgi:hypothetical protein